MTLLTQVKLFFKWYKKAPVVPTTWQTIDSGKVVEGYVLSKGKYPGKDGCYKVQPYWKSGNRFSHNRGRSDLDSVAGESYAKFEALRQQDDGMDPDHFTMFGEIAYNTIPSVLDRHCKGKLRFRIGAINALIGR